MSNDKIIKSKENTYKKVSKTKKLVYISLGLIITGTILFLLPLAGFNHTAIDQPISKILRFVSK
ncbi:MAG: hypothetical protein IJI84_01230 [Clostridia bacterium]|nr:hypothetical protein [Clostridia bacterium]